MKDVTLIIPSFRPPPSLPALCRELIAQGFHSILLVDDGSPAGHEALWAQLHAEGVRVLHLPHNTGKGNALKVGFAHALAENPTKRFFACCDDDGQHAPCDVARVVRVALEQEHPFVLGSRTFGGQTPWKSWLGNKVMSLILRLRFSIHAPDSQSGLRCFQREVAQELLSYPGERFGFEMVSLIRLHQAGTAFHPVPIQSIYYEKNRLTRFRAVGDSFHVMRIALGLVRSKD